MVEPYDIIAPFYDAMYQTPIDQAEDMLTSHLLRLHGIHPGMRVLDLGCGTGTLLHLMPFPTTRYLGIDPSNAMLEKAKEKFPDHAFLNTTFEDAPLRLNQYDAIIALYESFNYVKDPGGAAYKMHTLLKRDGLIFLQVSTKKWVDSDLNTLKRAGVEALYDLLPYTLEDTAMFNLYFDNVYVTGFHWDVRRAYENGTWSKEFLYTALMGEYLMPPKSPEEAYFLIITGRKREIAV